MLHTFIQMIHRSLTKIFFLSIAISVSLLLTACQKQEWHQQKHTLEGYTIDALFPTQPAIMERSYSLFDEQAEPLQMVQWIAVKDQSSFNLSYMLVPEHLEPEAVAKELLRSMNLKRDPRLEVAPDDFKEVYEQDLPALGEPFKLSVGVETKHLIATAKVVQEGRLIVQLYTAGPESNSQFEEQSERFFQELKIGATID